MANKTPDVSDFSFRTFDIYRRFVEVLQLKPAYLQEFKTGSPTKEACLAVIKRVFQSQQSEEDIKKYTQYFAIHAKMMAAHAENLPDNWDDAIDYTDRYIKEIRKYLRRKGISIRSGLDSAVDEIAQDIGKHIHDSPTAKQIEAIRTYLKHDLRNLKRNLTSSSTPKKSKSKSDRESTSFVKAKSQIIDDKIVEEHQVTFVEKENVPSSSTYESAQESSLLQQINNEEYNNNNNEVMETPTQFENIETEIVNDLFEITDSSVQYKIDMNSSDNFNYEEDVMTPELNPSNTLVGIEKSSETEVVEETREIIPSFKTDSINPSLAGFKIVNEDRCPNHHFYLKRKSSSPVESDHYYSLKKQLQACRRIPKNIPQKRVVTPSQATHIKSSSDNSSDSEINLENNNKGEQMSRFFIMNQCDDSTESESKTSFDSEISEQMKNSIFNLKAKARDMSYADAVKHIDLAATFCELKNAITQEELLVMQQIRDKMYFKSLNERSTM